MLAADLVDVDALWHVLLYSFLGSISVVLAFGTLVIALDRRDRSTATEGARAAWLTTAALAGLFCVAILVVGVWAMTQKS